VRPDLTQQLEIKIRTKQETIVKELIRRYPRLTFRELLLRSDLSPEDIWRSLKCLRDAKVIESIKISNRKSGYKLQYTFDRR
jgi:hypothetical protein